MDAKHQNLHGTTGLTVPTTPLSSMGAHTRAPNRAPSPPSTGSLTNRGQGAR